MIEPLILRDDAAAPGLLVVRLGAVTLGDEHLRLSAEDCHARWGVWGFSVLEVPGGDYAELARLRPIVAERRQLLVAHGANLIEGGFPLLPTLDAPHWTVALAAPIFPLGNVAVAGHRNTHGEPFRYINRLQPGDPIVVETQDAYYTYKMASILPQTSPSNVSVIAPVPEGAGFDGPGRYITLTTCTPEFTSTYRMIVWGKMVDERPRSKGKPDALVE